MPNRLAGESSPYLLQHADNPVDWYPWGPEAFARARELDRPIFVSIGYAACHWCHVMAHESFEDADTAALMNQLFVNIKVDREERPDVDTIYMNAIQVLGEGGGWPLSAFCLPDGRPYFLGTYFPVRDRYDRPGFGKVLRAMAQAYREERDKVMENVEGLVDGLVQVDRHYRGAPAAAPAPLAGSMLVTAGRQIAQRCDPEHGGLAGAPKFPSTSAHEVLARAARLEFGGPARDAFTAWARGMANGGIYDHLGGGFARYSVDERWLVPHFEKMLYDNGQLLGIYGDALAMTGDDAYRRVIVETVAWLERELAGADGGLWASLDADSDGHEGAFYVWTPAQVKAALGPIDALHLMKACGVSEGGNFERGASVLSRVTPPGPASDEAHLDALRAKLLAARSKRVRPATDDKVLSGWNALAVSGLCRAWAASGHAPALALAVKVGGFLRSKMIDGGGGAGGARVARVWKEGRAKLDGTLDDYAFTARAMLDLAEATGDASWWQTGAALVGAIRARFYQADDGGVFYLTADDEPEPLIHRSESHHDGAIPSGAGVAIAAMVRLGHVGGDEEALAIAEAYLARRLGSGALGPLGAASLLCALDDLLHGQVVVVSDGDGREALVAAARAAFAPSRMIAGPWAAASVLEGKTPAKEGRARAFVCRGMTCSAPVTEPAALAALLAAPP
ncbi:MAG TPA: thioredoxin domain-containing protein [Kofleriaceae bacterium]|nr:thioredoxin domain-containing protein [Kofleriaceae bacterium]